MIDREAALDLLREPGPESHLVQHALASEAVMRALARHFGCLLYTSPSPRDGATSRMPSSA